MHIEYAHYLHLQKRNHSMAKSGISNLTLKLAKGFGKKSQAVFKTSATTNEIVDLLRLQWSMYQIEEIPPSMYLTENELSKRENHHQTFYCKYALDYCGLFVDKGRPKSKYVRVNTYWQCWQADGKWRQHFEIPTTICSCQSCFEPSSWKRGTRERFLNQEMPPLSPWIFHQRGYCHGVKVGERWVVFSWSFE